MTLSSHDTFWILFWAIVGFVICFTSFMTMLRTRYRAQYGLADEEDKTEDAGISITYGKEEKKS